MLIEVQKYEGAKKIKDFYVQVNSYNKIADNSSLLLVDDGSLTLNDINKEEARLIEIHKVQFIATCKVKEFADELLVAFYLGEGSNLSGFIISELPNGYTQRSNMVLVDYKSYTEICDMTGEKKLPFKEYLDEAKSGNIQINSLLEYKDKTYNSDAQPEFFKSYDETQKKVLGN